MSSACALVQNKISTESEMDYPRGQPADMRTCRLKRDEIIKHGVAKCSRNLKFPRNTAIFQARKRHSNYNAIPPQPRTESRLDA